MDGSILIGQKTTREGDGFFQATDPATGTLIEARFPEATPAQVATACALADAAFDHYAQLPPEETALFLETIAEEILAIVNEDRHQWIIKGVMGQIGHQAQQLIRAHQFTQVLAHLIDSLHLLVTAFEQIVLLTGTPKKFGILKRNSALGRNRLQ